MLCQNCNLNESTIHLYTNVNGKKKQVDLCQNCYQIMKTDPTNPILGGLNGGQRAQERSSTPFFDDFFGDLNNFRAFGNLPNTPPTQAGQNGNGGGRHGGHFNGQRPTQPQTPNQQAKGLLEEFGINVTDIARHGDIDPVIGRDDEITRVIEILNRRTKNNPVLIGE